jgi:hypothetical protein
MQRYNTKLVSSAGEVRFFRTPPVAAQLCVRNSFHAQDKLKAIQGLQIGTFHYLGRFRSSATKLDSSLKA